MTGVTATSDEEDRQAGYEYVPKWPAVACMSASASKKRAAAVIKEKKWGTVNEVS
jgi:hypothetical protein